MDRVTQPHVSRLEVEGGTASSVIDLSNPWPQVPPVPLKSVTEIHADQAEAALAAFEQTGDWRHGLAALVHAILSIDIREAGHQ